MRNPSDQPLKQRVWRQRRFPLAALERFLLYDAGVEPDFTVHGTTHITTSVLGIYPVWQVAVMLNVDRTYIYRWVEFGVPPEAAERVAIRLSVHPTAIWPDYYVGYVIEAHDEQRGQTCA